MTDSSREKITDTSAANQRARLLERLQIGPIDTVTARAELNVLHPAARVQELREAGHHIVTHRSRLEDAQGHSHAGVAVYYLGGQP